MVPSKPAGTLSSASMQSVAQRAHNFASIWSGWQQWRLTQKLKRAILRWSSNWWQRWTEWVKRTCNNSSVAVEMYNSSANNQQQEGDRDTETNSFTLARSELKWDGEMRVRTTDLNSVERTDFWKTDTPNTQQKDKYQLCYDLHANP